MDIFNAFAADQVMISIITTAVLLTVADLVVGIAAAARNKTFQLDLVAEFISSHVVGRVFPIVAVAALGHFEAALAALAATAAAAYTLETVGSIRDSLVGSAPEDGVVPEEG